MKIIKFIASFLLILGILTLVVWTGYRAKKHTCRDISVLIYNAGNSELLTKSDILDILKKNNLEWNGKRIEEIDPAIITKILEKENYIETVENVHFSGSILQIEVSLYDILLEIAPKTGENFLLDVNGVCLPHSPKLKSDVIVATGYISPMVKKNGTTSVDNNDLQQIYNLAILLKNDLFYAKLFNKMRVDEKQNIMLLPTDEKLPVLFGNMENAEKKLKTLRYMYKEVLPYMKEDKYTQLDVRFENRIVAKKIKNT
jgi:cell division protein FtsQ